MVVSFFPLRLVLEFVSERMVGPAKSRFSVPLRLERSDVDSYSPTNFVNLSILVIKRDNSPCSDQPCFFSIKITPPSLFAYSNASRFCEPPPVDARYTGCSLFRFLPSHLLRVRSQRTPLDPCNGSMRDFRLFLRGLFKAFENFTACRYRNLEPPPLVPFSAQDSPPSCRSPRSVMTPKSTR